MIVIAFSPILEGVGVEELIEKVRQEPEQEIETLEETLDQS